MHKFKQIVQRKQNLFYRSNGRGLVWRDHRSHELFVQFIFTEHKIINHLSIDWFQIDLAAANQRSNLGRFFPHFEMIKWNVMKKCHTDLSFRHYHGLFHSKPYYSNPSSKSNNVILVWLRKLQSYSDCSMSKLSHILNYEIMYSVRKEI